MINLFENYTHLEVLLEDSLNQAGYRNQSVVLNDNGYLPLHVVSPIGFFTGMDILKKVSDKFPKFFNDISIPYYWEINGNGVMAEIFEGYKKKGQINYSKRPGDYRLVESVDWLNDDGRIRSTDLYNQIGQLFGRKTYSDGEHVLTSYFNAHGNEVIAMNNVTKTVQVKYHDKCYVFNSFENFVLFYFEVAQIEVNFICYNSLGRPHFVSNALKRHALQNIDYNHILFWQETSQSMPGNMKQILGDVNSPTKQIVVQNQEEYARLLKQVGSLTTAKISYLGYIYRIKEKNTFTPSIFILTNSDQVLQIDELVPLLSEYKIVIAAKTEMSQRLLKLEEEINVQLYPNASDQEISSLIENASLYLDINYGEEVDDILWKAFENNLLILGFNETLHNRKLMSNMNCFDAKDFLHLSDKINHIKTYPESFFEELYEQQKEAGNSSIEEYREVLE